MTNLLAISTASTNGSVTISSNYVKWLFEKETEALWNIVHTNLALTLEFNQSQPDLVAYLTNQAARAYWEERQAAVRQGQARTIAASSAAVLVQSQLTEAPASGFKVPEWVTPVINVVGGCATLIGTGGANWGPIISSTSGLIGLFETAESPDEQIVREIGNIKTQISDLSTNMNYRFDRVDQSLTTIFNTLNERFDQVQITIDAQGRQIAHLNGEVDSIRESLVDVQTSLYRIERNVATFHALDWRFDLLEQMNLGLDYEANVGNPMQYQDFTPSYVGLENTFYTHAYNRAAGETLSRYTTLPFGAEHFYSQLSPGGATNVYAETLNYIKKALRQHLSLGGFPEVPILANPQDWNAGAGAWMQLALENPSYFRRFQRTVGYPSRLDDISSRGRDLTNFFASLVFTGTNINGPLYTALENFYFTKLISFNDQVSDTEGEYATNNNFALGTWRQWDIVAPRVTASATAVRLATPKNLIAAGGWHSLALKPDGKVVGWGGNYDIVGNYTGQATVPSGLSGVTAIAAGQSHSLALKADSTVVGWGNNVFGQTTIPAGLTSVVAIAVGSVHSLALKADGTVVGWGYDSYGQANIPTDLTNVVAIAAGAGHSLALKADGTVVGWGDNTLSQTNIPTDLTNVVAIAAGSVHSLALKADGTVVGWGDDGNGETTIPPGLTDVVAVAGGAMHSLALKADGTVVGWGNNDAGQITIPASAANVVAIAAGSSHNLALKADGVIVGWGDNSYGQCIPRGWLASPRVRTHIAAGMNHSLALRADGTVVGWGRNNYGQATIPPGLTDVVAIAAGGWGFSSFSLALRADGTVVGWGYNDYGQTTIPTSATNVVAIAAGSEHSLALRADGTVFGWGRNAYDVTTNIPAGATNVVAIAAGYHYSLALRADGTVVGWGGNFAGVTDIPAGATNVVAIEAGGAGNEPHCLALRADGTIVGWGNNSYGETTIPASATNVVAIAADGRHSLALRADGTVVGWGRNDYGQTTVPANVIDLAAWGDHRAGLWNAPSVSSPMTAVTAGSAHCLTLTASGSVVAWGLNMWGQANVPPQAQSGVQAVASGLGHNLVLATKGSVLAWGLNDFGQTNVPASAQSGVVEISAGGKHCLALKTNGSVVPWGLNGSGQGNVPPEVQGQAVAIDAGGEHSLALTADGKVWAWGGNSSGQTVVPPGALSGVVAIAAGRYHNLALKAGGTVVGWGNNACGQTDIPTSLHKVVAIAAGMRHSLALKADGTIVVWGSGPATFVPPQDWNNVVAIAAGDHHSILLVANTAPGINSPQTLSLVRAQIPVRVAILLSSGNDYLNAELGRVGPLQTASTELSGAKALLQAVLELGMPYTLERDDVLHGFLYGSESLVDLEATRTFLNAENTRLAARPDAAPKVLSEVAALRHLRFAERLQARLDDLQATGQPEIPRLVGHTLRLLNLLRDAWPSVPPSALALGQETNALRLILYGEPYAHYTLEHSDNLSVSGWTNDSTNLRNDQLITLPVSGPSRFYRGLLPVP